MLPHHRHRHHRHQDRRHQARPTTRTQTQDPASQTRRPSRSRASKEDSARPAAKAPPSLARRTSLQAPRHSQSACWRPRVAQHQRSARSSAHRQAMPDNAQTKRHARPSRAPACAHTTRRRCAKAAARTRQCGTTGYCIECHERATQKGTLGTGGVSEHNGLWCPLPSPVPVQCPERQRCSRANPSKLHFIFWDHSIINLINTTLFPDKAITPTVSV